MLPGDPGSARRSTRKRLPALRFGQLLPFRKDLNASDDISAHREEKRQLVVRGGLYRPPRSAASRCPSGSGPEKKGGRAPGAWVTTGSSGQGRVVATGGPISPRPGATERPRPRTSRTSSSLSRRRVGLLCSRVWAQAPRAAGELGEIRLAKAELPLSLPYCLGECGHPFRHPDSSCMRAIVHFARNTRPIDPGVDSIVIDRAHQHDTAHHAAATELAST